MTTRLKNLLRRPETLFIVVALFIIVWSFFFWGESLVIDVFGLTIFIDGITVLYLLSFSMVIYWTMYKISNRFLFSQHLVWLHISITVGMVFILLISGKWFLKSEASSDLQAHILKQLMINRERSISLTSALGMIFILGQLIFLINLMAGLFRRKP